MEDIVIIGAGGFGREVLEIFKRQNRDKKKWKILGFIDDDKEKWNKIFNGYPILGGVDWLISNSKKIKCVCAIAEPKIKRKICDYLTKYHIGFINAIDPSVICSDSINIGQDVIICAGCILTVDIEIGNHVIININSTVGHDSYIGSYSSIMPGSIINGNNHIHEGVYIGTGAKMIHNISIGSWSVIGAGAVVIKDIPEKVMAAGVPAKIIKRIKNGAS